MSAGQIYAGTSGYSYPEWKGSFYPERLPQKGFLEFYAGKFSTVEINKRSIASRGRACWRAGATARPTASASR